jgi:4-amino-4-deoxy-L-arabinose transferase-like glycosyltransferase
MFGVFGYKITKKQILIAILIAAAILRFWSLGSTEIFHDEGFYAFRSIGYVDYLQNNEQTTPIQWLAVSSPNGSLPFWTSLSFHDHPPFFFFIQHLFFKIFGDSIFVARLPSALAGLASVWLVFLLGKKFFRNEWPALLAAGFLAVNSIHIWISRNSLIEALLIFLILFNIYLFFRALENAKYWKWWGLILGVVFLTKYTGFFLIPVYAVYLAIESIWGSRASVLKDWRFYASLGLALLIFSPVIIYNFFLWKTTGHFDLQFAYLFGQKTPEWRASIGKVQEPFKNILLNLSTMYSWPSLLAVLGGIIFAFYWIYKFYRTDKSNWTYSVFGLLAIGFLTLMLVPVGSAFRFISLYAPFFAFFMVLFWMALWAKINQNLFKILLALFIAYEVFFAVSGIFVEYPDLGVRKLDQYLDKVLPAGRSPAVPRSPNPHLDKIIQQYASQYAPADHPFMVVYDENLTLTERLWLYTRRTFYHGIPTLTTGIFRNLLQSRGLEAFKNYEIYFVRATENTALNEFLSLPDAAELEGFLGKEFKIGPEKVIYGHGNLPMFRIYKILL